MARAKIDKEKQIREEAEAQITHIKTIGERTIRRKNRKIKRLTVAMAVLCVVLVGAIVAGGFAYNNLKNENKRLSNPQEAAKSETERIKKEVAALIDVPTDEEPTIANVSDAAKAKEQSPTFFAKAENDDRLLMYTKAKKAILYRPSTNRIIEVSTLNIGNTNQPGAATTEQAPTPAGTQAQPTQTTP